MMQSKIQEDTILVLTSSKDGAMDLAKIYV